MIDGEEFSTLWVGHSWACDPGFYFLKSRLNKPWRTVQEATLFQGLRIRSWLQVLALFKFLSWFPSMINVDMDKHKPNKFLPPQFVCVHGVFTAIVTITKTIFFLDLHIQLWCSCGGQIECQRGKPVGNI